jgi:alpha-D-ribose 1-methylphosphonate 5-triphosphate synthase subunit PhnG
MHHSHILANCPAEAAYHLGAQVAQGSPGQIHLLTGPRLGLVMLNVRESVAERQFYAGEILVTEVTVELGGQFGFGMIIGNDPRRALAAALVDAALARNDALAGQLRTALDDLAAAITHTQRQAYRAVAASKVDFTVF